MNGGVEKMQGNTRVGSKEGRNRQLHAKSGPLAATQAGRSSCTRTHRQALKEKRFLCRLHLPNGRPWRCGEERHDVVQQRRVQLKGACPVARHRSLCVRVLMTARPTTEYIGGSEGSGRTCGCLCHQSWLASPWLHNAHIIDMGWCARSQPA